MITNYTEPYISQIIFTFHVVLVSKKINRNTNKGLQNYITKNFSNKENRVVADSLLTDFMDLVNILK